MKKIVPFNNTLTFNTDVCEITAISLEHEIKKDSTCISGTFFISGEYKITDGQLAKEIFNFELPFDIALGSEYDMDTLVVDIDDFRYELLDNKRLKVNIDLFIDGEEIVNPINISEEDIIEPNLDDKNEETIIPSETTNSDDLNDRTNVEKEDIEIVQETEVNEESKNLEESQTKNINNNKSLSEKERNELDDNNLINDIEDDLSKIEINNHLDLLDEMLENKKEAKMEEENTNINIVNNNINMNNNDNEVESDTNNIFGAFNEDEEYVTYRVYRVMENDTLNNILEKYNISKEELAKYNNIEEIHPGVKLIIPANGK